MTTDNRILPTQNSHQISQLTLTSKIQQASNPKSIAAWLILLVAALNGLIYVFIVPPWQNNDEMGQFEYAWLIANYGRLPNQGEYDQTLRREILASMIENDFFIHNPVHPNIIGIEEPIWIGPEQVGGLPIYYWLLSLPLRLFPGLDVTFQLYVSRVFSWILFIGTIVIIKLLTEEIFIESHLISTIFIFPSLLPGFVNKMVAVNDDVAAIFFMTLYLWFGTRILMRGWNIGNAIGLLGSLILAFFTKQTTWTSVPLLLFVFVFGLFRQRRERLLVGTWILIFAIVLAFVYISWGKSAPAYYYGAGGGEPPVQARHSQSVKGMHVLEINPYTSDIYQVIDVSRFIQSEVKTFSLGFWAWSTQSASMSYPRLVIDGQDYQANESVELSQKPEFFMVIYSIEDRDIQKGVLRFDFGSLKERVTLHFDCLLLVPGDPKGALPTVQDEQCQFVVWGEYAGKNLVRNGSFEKSWPIPKPFVIRGPISIDNLHLYNSVMGLLDPLASSYYLRSLFSYLFKTFWGRFGWGTIPYLGCPSYWPFYVLSGLALMGFLIVWIKKGEHRWIRNENIVYFYSLLFLAQLTIVYLREAGNWSVGYLLLPQARYIFPVIFPISVFFGVGWYHFIVMTIPKLERFIFERICLMIMMTINAWALISIWSYYK